MALPASYTEETLAAYMHNVLGSAAVTLGWDAETSYDEPINEVLLLLGIATVEESDNIPMLRAAARWAVWKQVVAEVSLSADFASDGQILRRSQRLAGAEKMLRLAESDLAEFGIAPNWIVEMYEIEHTSSPFRAGERGAEFG